LIFWVKNLVFFPGISSSDAGSSRYEDDSDFDLDENDFDDDDDEAENSSGSILTIFGACGSGKTCFVHCLAHDLGFKVNFHGFFVEKFDFCSKFEGY